MPEAIAEWSRRHDGAQPNQAQLYAIRQQVTLLSRESKTDGAIDWDAHAQEWDVRSAGALAQFPAQVSNMRGPGGAGAARDTRNPVGPPDRSAASSLVVLLRRMSRDRCPAGAAPGSMVTPDPVVVAGARGALACRLPLPGTPRQGPGDGVSALRAGGGADLVAAGDGQCVPGAVVLQFAAQPGIGAVDLVAGDPPGGRPAVQRPDGHLAGQFRPGRELPSSPAPRRRSPRAGQPHPRARPPRRAGPGHQPRTGAGTRHGRSGRARRGWRRSGTPRPARSRSGLPCRCTGAAPPPCGCPS